MTTAKAAIIIAMYSGDDADSDVIFLNACGFMMLMTITNYCFTIKDDDMKFLWCFACKYTFLLSRGKHKNPGNGENYVSYILKRVCWNISCTHNQWWMIVVDVGRHKWLASVASRGIIKLKWCLLIRAYFLWETRAPTKNSNLLKETFKHIFTFYHFPQVRRCMYFQAENMNTFGWLSTRIGVTAVLY